MADEHSTDIRDVLKRAIAEAGLLREHRTTRHDAGDVLDYEITGVCPARRGRARLLVERCVGGGFAGQVYRVRVDRLEAQDGPIEGLQVGRNYALKIIVPPSGLARRFRNAVYWTGYQGSFSAQVNPCAARTGVLWQKLIRRGARIRLGTEQAVVDTYASLFDPALRSFGEINEWVDGRNWRFEIDDRVFSRGRWRGGDGFGSPEYVAKRRFMDDLVSLLHEMGAHELARQYEWWTAKSQPNVLKRDEAGEGPQDGLTAIDFRAGLALLCFLPMSPADPRLILQGAARGDLVQFDRGDLDRLETFVASHAAEFEDLRPALEELREADPAYRASLPDVTHHHVELLTSRKLRDSVEQGYLQAWSVKSLIDEERAAKLQAQPARFLVFLVVGLLPFLGRLLRRCWGDPLYAEHVKRCLTSFAYLRRYFRASAAGVLLAWRRDGRVEDDRALFLLNRPVRLLLERVLAGWLPASWHRFLAQTIPEAWAQVRSAVAYPIRFYFDAAFREKWLTEIIREGRREGMLTEEEEREVFGQVKDPFIQKYLKCVAVHLCTLPVTQVVSLLVAVYAFARFGKTWQESLQWAVGVLVFFQVTPISPGSLTRGSYVVYVMIRERNLRNYWLAGLVSFWHYVGYLGFPLQMVQHYPTLSRFLAGRWATRMVRFVPVFGERGALLEHWVFDVFFNVPLTLRRYWFKLPSGWRLTLTVLAVVFMLAGVIALVWAVRLIRH